MYTTDTLFPHSLYIYLPPHSLHRGLSTTRLRARLPRTNRHPQPIPMTIPILVIPPIDIHSLLKHTLLAQFTRRTNIATTRHNAENRTHAEPERGLAWAKVQQQWVSTGGRLRGVDVRGDGGAVVVAAVDVRGLVVALFVIRISINQCLYENGIFTSSEWPSTPNRLSTCSRDPGSNL